MKMKEFLAAAARRYYELQASNKLDNFYDYEKQFVGIGKTWAGKSWRKTLMSNPGTSRKKKGSSP